MSRPAAGSVGRLAVAITALAMLIFAPSAAAVRTEFFGIVQGPSLDDRDLQGMQAARVHTDRYLLSWSSIQPHSGSFNWGGTDRFFGRLAAHGIRVLPSLWGNPNWVYGGEARPPLDNAQSTTAWKNFLKAVVARYGRGGTFWSGRYRQVYGASATPLPIQAWQIWNEPNLKKFYIPYPSPKSYAKLLDISHDAIKSVDSQAQIIIGGLTGNGDISAWDFLNQMYPVSGVKANFDAVALHPYAADVDHQRNQIEKVRTAMRNHADAPTPLWITEIAWGSAPPDRFGINKGLQGQATGLTDSYNLILGHRKAWNVQRLFWYHWRDPQQGSGCSFCGSAGLLRYDRTKKPAYNRFVGFTAETTPPVASITSGPSQGGVTSDPTPTFAFTSNEPGSTFECRVDAGSFKACASPFTTARLSNSAHTFSVRAIDAPGNVSAVVSRSFTVAA